MSVLDPGEVRALLRAFVASDLLDLSVRTAAGSIFMAKAGGQAACPPTHASKNEPPPGHTRAIMAPHCGILSDRLPIGSRVGADTTIAVLSVLHERRPILAGQDGVVAELSKTDGGFVEYGAVIVQLATNTAA